jgi:hypothetical protein
LDFLLEVDFRAARRPVACSSRRYRPSSSLIVGRSLSIKVANSTITSVLVLATRALIIEA